MKKSLEIRLFNSTKSSQKTQKLESEIKLLIFCPTQYFHQLLLIRQCSTSGFLSEESETFVYNMRGTSCWLLHELQDTL